MKPAMQTIWRDGDPTYDELMHVGSDCLRACVASILELPIENVPNFILAERGGGEYLEVMSDFLRQFDLQALTVSFHNMEDPANWKPDGYHMIYGWSPRGVKHAVVGYQGEMVHDPHPCGGGLTAVDSYTIFVSRVDTITLAGIKDTLYEARQANPV